MQMKSNSTSLASKEPEPARRKPRKLCPSWSDTDSCFTDPADHLGRLRWAAVTGANTVLLVMASVSGPISALGAVRP